jgi:hypothetical protein
VGQISRLLSIFASIFWPCPTFFKKDNILSYTRFEHCHGTDQCPLDVALMQYCITAWVAMQGGFWKQNERPRLLPSEAFVIFIDAT